MEKQNKNENTVKTEDINQSKPKKHSNKKAVLIVLGGFFILCVVVIIATGGWNPFKSRDVSADAKTVYEESEKTELDIYKDVASDDNYDFENDNSIYGKNGEHPMGLDTKDYGPKGDATGCLKYTYTGSAGYSYTYGLSFRTYYMKNSEYAREKYASIKGGLQAQASYSKEQDIPTGKVYSYIMAGGDTFMQFAVQHNSVSYEMWGAQSDLSKMQALFDKLGIDFKVPTLEEIQSK